jgi:GT2 family glycosyltransferase
MSTKGGEVASGRPAGEPTQGSSSRPRPSVAILTVNTEGGLFMAEFLTSLRDVSYSNFTLVLVDNGSKDRSLETLGRLWPEAVVIRNESNLGFTGASNRGIEYCLKHDFDYVLFLNTDARFEPDFLDRLVDASDERTMTAPKTYLYHHPGRLDDSIGEFNWSRGVWKRRILGSVPTPEFDTPRQIGNANLSCLLVSSTALRDIGPLDEKFFVYYDDTDFVRRAYDKGYCVWFRPEAVIYHRKGATIGGPMNPFGLYYLTRNRPYLIHKHTRSRIKLARFWAYYMTGRVARVVLWTLRRRPDLSIAILRGLRDYFLGRMGKTLERDGRFFVAADPGLRLSEGQLSEGRLPKA